MKMWGYNMKKINKSFVSLVFLAGIGSGLNAWKNLLRRIGTEELEVEAYGVEARVLVKNKEYIKFLKKREVKQHIKLMKDFGFNDD